MDQFPPGVPEEFQKSGVTALVYDPRNTGRSGGFPRNEIDPFKQVEDYSDAFIYLTTLPLVNPEAIVFWGISLSAGIALCDAAVDRRVAAVIAIAPIFKFFPATEADVVRIKSKLMKDRESQIIHRRPPFVLPLMESLAQVPLNSHITVHKDKDDEEKKRMEEEEQTRLAEEWKSATATHDEYDPAITHNPLGTTMQSYHRMILYEHVPLALVKSISPTPVFFLTPEFDQISPPADQTAVFESLQGPKRQLIAPGKEHIHVLNGLDMPLFVKWQIDFIWHVVRGRFKRTVLPQPLQEEKVQVVVNVLAETAG